MDSLLHGRQWRNKKEAVKYQIVKYVEDRNADDINRDYDCLSVSRMSLTILYITMGL